MDTLYPLIAYFRHVVEDGDYLNDHLTHMPEPLAQVVQIIGYLLALLGGF